MSSGCENSEIVGEAVGVGETRGNGEDDFGETGILRVRTGGTPVPQIMIGRSFIRSLGARDDIRELLGRYIAASQAELSGDRPVLGRMKELIAYWKDLPQWRRKWDVIKMCRTVDELRLCLGV